MNTNKDLIELEAIAKELERRKYRDNLYLLAKDILGYDLMSYNTHNELCLFAQYDDNEANIETIDTPHPPQK